jgi:hypothetical protein
MIINTKLHAIYITLTCDDLHNFGKINWPDNFDRYLYMPVFTQKTWFLIKILDSIRKNMQIN